MRIRRLALITLGLGLVAIVAIIAAVLLDDVEPPIDSHMAVAATRIPDAVNGLLPYTDATGQIVTRGKSSSIPEDLFHRFVENQDLTLLEVLRENEAALAGFDAAMAREHFVIPVVDDFADPIPSLLDLGNLRNLVLLRARLRHLLGERSAALDDCVHLLRLGHAFQAGNSVLISSMIGQCAKIETLDLLIEIAHTSDVPPAEIHRLRAELERYHFTPTMIENVVKREYICAVNMLHQIDQNPALLAQLGPGTNVLQQFFYKRNVTHQKFLEYYERAVEDVGKPLDEHTAAKWARNLGVELRSWKRFVRGNLGGESLLGCAFPWMGGFAECVYFERVADVLLALRLYHFEHGTIPDALDDLVPDYLTEVPRDPFDGEPLRYSADPAEIYSPGNRSDKAQRYRVPIRLKRR